jgi:peroxiredoxin
MKLRHSLNILVLSVISILHSVIALADTASVGKPAPAFSLQNALGQSVSLSQFSGKVVVLEWFNQDCPFVKKFYSNNDMQRFQKQARDKGAVWLTVNSSAEGKQGHITAAEAASFAKERGLDPAALLLDPEGTVGRAYGARTTPHMFVIDSKGGVAYAGAIDSTASTRSSDIASSSNYVLQAVDALMQGRTPAPATTDSYGCSVKYK